MPIIQFEIEYKEEMLEDMITMLEDDGTKDLSIGLNNIRKLILEGLRTVNTELSLIKTQHLSDGGSIPS